MKTTKELKDQTGIDPEKSFEFVLNWMRKAYEKARDDLFGILADYEEKFGEEGVMDLHGFIVYASERKVPEKKIKSTITHDLNGVNKDVFLPKTYGCYKKLKIK